jgi:hypothetical protein
VIDACLFGEDELQMLFSFARAYFMVDMEIPSAYVQFLRSLMPRKPRAEIYNALGLAKQGKTLFYRDFLYHLKHSSDKFRIAPGIKGMVMLVFDLPSFPYVFKVIKDYYPPQKDTTREQIQGKYLLVKQHDRVGRMADTLEYSEVAFARDRFEDELIEEIRKFAPSQLEISDRDGDGHEEVIIKHLYIERRMIPLNIYLQEAFDAGAQGAGAARDEHAWSSTATPSRTWWPPTSSPATCCGRTSASPATARSCSTTTTRSSTSPSATSARCRRRATRRRSCPARSGTRSARATSSRRPSGLPAGQPGRARGLPAHHADLLDAGVLAGPQGAHPGRPRARRLPVRTREALRALRRHENRAERGATPGNWPASSSRRWACRSPSCSSPGSSARSATTRKRSSTSCSPTPTTTSSSRAGHPDLHCAPMSRWPIQLRSSASACW